MCALDLLGSVAVKLFVITVQGWGHNKNISIRRDQCWGGRKVTIKTLALGRDQCVCIFNLLVLKQKENMCL